MISLPIKLPQCPTCQINWTSGAIRDMLNQSNRHWHCAQCNFEYSESEKYSYAFLFKKIGEKYDVWWCSDGPCELLELKNLNSNYVYKKLSFTLPFNITEEQLKLYLIMS